MDDVEAAAKYLQTAAKYAADGVSLGVLVGTLANALPSIAALMTIIWTAIRISESKRFEQLLDWLRRKD